jgi:hypothetical protein
MKINELAKKINRKGDLYIQKHGTKDFHKLATELLLTSDLSSRFDYQDIVNAAFDNTTSLKQNFKQLEFSDLPLTLARGENCFIDIYFWRRRPTVIHNHHFSGAFMCLTGNNVDLEFSFNKTSKIGKYHDVGELVLRHSRNLRSGDVATIAPMDKFIHQNHHQAELTVNLCFRTPEIPNKSLSNYLFSGLRFEKNPVLLGRVSRLRRFIDLGDFKFKNVNVTSDDAVNFLIQNHRTNSQNPRLHRIMKILDKRLQDEFNLNVPKLMDDHEAHFEKLENEYE